MVPFAASTLHVRIGTVLYNIAEVMATIICWGLSLYSTVLWDLSIAAHGGTDDSVQAVGKSGVYAYEKPTWNGTDLNQLCPGSSTPIQIRDDIPLVAAASAEVNKKLALGLGLFLD